MVPSVKTSGSSFWLRSDLWVMRSRLALGSGLVQSLLEFLSLPLSLPTPLLSFYLK